MGMLVIFVSLQTILLQEEQVVVHAARLVHIITYRSVK